METLKYKIIKSKTQYKTYCKKLEEIISGNKQSKSAKEEVELLTFLIEKYDEEHNTFEQLDPIQLLHVLMNDHKLKAKDLVEILDVSKGMVSDILHYKKGLSKDIIRTLASHFKVSQEAFNRLYKLKTGYNPHVRDAGVMNAQRRVAHAR